jgi:hypothetical protein
MAMATGSWTKEDLIAMFREHLRDTHGTGTQDTKAPPVETYWGYLSLRLRLLLGEEWAARDQRIRWQKKTGRSLLPMVVK